MKLRYCKVFIKKFSRRHVHSGCDPEANEQSVLEKRVSQLNYMFVCRICKSGGRSASTPGTPSSALGYDDDSNDASWEDMDSNSGVGAGSFSFGRSISYGGSAGIGGGSSGVGMQGKGKPMSAFPATTAAGKRGRRGYYGMGGATSAATAAGTYGRSRSYASGSPYYGASSAGSAGGVDGTNKPGLGMKKRGVEAAAARRRGRQPKIRGMVGLQV